MAYRIVRGVHRSDPDMLDSFRSKYELGSRPRGLEVEAALIQMGLSMYLHADMAATTARCWPGIGNRIAELRLEPDRGLCYAATGRPGHITTWGRPLQLLGCVADILAVGD